MGWPATQSTPLDPSLVSKTNSFVACNFIQFVSTYLALKKFFPYANSLVYHIIAHLKQNKNMNQFSVLPSDWHSREQQWAEPERNGDWHPRNWSRGSHAKVKYSSSDIINKSGVATHGGKKEWPSCCYEQCCRKNR